MLENDVGARALDAPGWRIESGRGRRFGALYGVASPAGAGPLATFVSGPVHEQFVRNPRLRVHHGRDGPLIIELRPHIWGLPDTHVGPVLATSVRAPQEPDPWLIARFSRDSWWWLERAGEEPTLTERLAGRGTTPGPTILTMVPRGEPRWAAGFGQRDFTVVATAREGRMETIAAIQAWKDYRGTYPVALDVSFTEGGRRLDPRLLLALVLAGPGMG